MLGADLGKPLLAHVLDTFVAVPGGVAYPENRHLVEQSAKYSLSPFEDAKVAEQIAGYTRRLYTEYSPFDYGRFKFRVNEDTGEVSFLEVNLNCNL